MGDSTELQICASSSANEPSEDELQKCILLLKRVSSDTEKFAALLMVTKLVKADEINEDSSRRLMDAIGFNFLERMLATQEVPEACPPYIFKSIALTILSSFISNCHGYTEVYKLIPVIAEMISFSEIGLDLYDDDPVVLKEAYQCLTMISLDHSGRNALIEFGVVGILIDAYVSGSLLHEGAIEILRHVATDQCCEMWRNDSSSQNFTKLMEFLCKNFCDNQDDLKFDICEILTDILYSKTESNDCKYDIQNSWTTPLHKGISDILFSKLNNTLRDKGIRLAGVIVDVLGLSFLLNGGEKGEQLLLVVVHLACIEVRMNLEGKNFLESVSLAAPTCSSYGIIEKAISFFINGASNFRGRQKQQLYSALKSAFGGVLEFLNEASSEDIAASAYEAQVFTYASIKVLSAWLAEETTANKEEIYHILPFIIKVAQCNYDQVNESPSYELSSGEPHERKSRPKPPDLLRFLLPGFCHLTAEDHPRQILLGLHIENILIDYLNYHWNSTADFCLSKNTESSNFDTIITICNIFMNIVVQESERVKGDILYLNLFRFLTSRIRQIPDEHKNLYLIGCFCTLGLMIFRNRYLNISKTDMNTVRFILSTIRFLWDGFNVEESPDYATLVVSTSYQPIWADVAEFWFLSIQTLSVVLSYAPWICDFLIESDWPQTIVETFHLIKEDGIDKAVKTAFEDFLDALIRTSKVAQEVLEIKGIFTICKSHKLENLSRTLRNKHCQ